ncbi:MAG: nuclear transport factor 2 family protein [Gammaproteobacteria bacterium]|nr:nuclear transport factor 2 family protein [Gammaproteobacteria bacterium]
MKGGANRHDLLTKLFATIDAMDTAGFVAMLTPGAEFRFGGAPPVQSRAQIGAAVDEFFSTIAGLQHELHNVIDSSDLVACEGDVTYTRHDGSSVTVPFADVFDFDGDLIAGYRIYIDIGPLYAPTE